MIARKIEPKMIDFLLERLSGNGSYLEAVKRGDARSVFAFAMEAMVGIREHGGNNQGTMVRLIQETVGGASGEPWCMAAVQTGLAFAEYMCNVKSPIAVSEHCVTVWNQTPRGQRVKTSPLRGAIVIWQKGNSTSGHTGMFIEQYQKGRMRVAEGNTESGKIGDQVVREGGGFYLTERSMKSTPSMKVLGFLKPF